MMSENLPAVAGNELTVPLAADFAPIPWLGPAAEAVIAIMLCAQRIRANHHIAMQLGERCVLLLNSLKDYASGAPEPYTSITPPDHIKFPSIMGALQEIQQRTTMWASLPKLTPFTREMEMRKSIRTSHLLLDDCTPHFNLISDIESHPWQQDFERLANLDHGEILEKMSELGASHQIVQELAVENSGELKCIRNMMVSMQAGLSEFDIDDRRHTGLSRGLYDLQRTSGELLPSYILRHGEVRRVGTTAIRSTAVMDYWEGLYLGTEKVCIRVFHGVNVVQNAMKHFRRAVQIWRDVYEVDHGKHTLAFLGLCDSDGEYPCMVSPWMSNGNAIAYVRKHPEANRKNLVFGISKGLRILHEMEPAVVHGDIKGANIVINDNLEPLIAEFGMATILQNVDRIPSPVGDEFSETYRWFAPELATEPGELSTYSDVFSFAMTILELMTGEQPFAEIHRTPEVLLKLVAGSRPRRPTDPRVAERGLNDTVWQLLQRCWAAGQAPAERPSIQQMYEVLEALASTAT